MKKILYHFSLICLFSCEPGTQAKTENQATDTKSDMIITADADPSSVSVNVDDSALNADTLVLDSKSVIFFILDQEAFNALLKASGEEATDVNELYSDFFYHAGQVCTQLKDAGIRAEIVTNNVFKFNTKDGVEYYNRLDHSDTDLGVIVFDGKSRPLIDSELVSEIDILNLIDEKFAEYSYPEAE